MHLKKPQLTNKRRRHICYSIEMLWHCVNEEKTILEQQLPPAAHEKKNIHLFLSYKFKSIQLLAIDWNVILQILSYSRNQ